MEGLAVPHERRRSIRLQATGSIHMQAGALHIQAHLVDLALDGVCMHTIQTSGAVPLVGTKVKLDVQPDTAPGTHFMLQGRVLRANAVTQMVVVAFDDVSIEVIRWHCHEVLAAIRCDADALVDRRHNLAS